MTKIDEAQRALADERRALAAFAPAIARNRKLLAEATAERDRLEDRISAANAARADAFAASMLSGSLTAVPDPDDEQLTLDLMRAVNNVSVVSDALAQLEAKAAAARAAVKLAEGKVLAEVDQLVAAECLEFAKEVISLHAKFKAACEEFAARCPDALYEPINSERMARPEIAQAQALIPTPDLLNVPINEQNRHLLGPTELREALAARRAALLTGPPEPSESEAA
jgi:hypothetical protein